MLPMCGKSSLTHVPDFPKAGILFYDITTLLQDREGFRLAIDSLSLPFTDQGIDVVVGIDPFDWTIVT